MIELLQVHLPNVLEKARPILEQEGIQLEQETMETIPFHDAIANDF
jgi:hypothetical protein